jgi:hypothetical protein
MPVLSNGICFSQQLRPLMRMFFRTGSVFNVHIFRIVIVVGFFAMCSETDQDTVGCVGALQPDICRAGNNRGSWDCYDELFSRLVGSHGKVLQSESDDVDGRW